MKKIIISEELAQEIYNMYQNGNSVKKICDKYGYSTTVIDRVFKEHGWKKRGKHAPEYCKYQYNRNFFDNIDTPNKAYCLGLLYADGSNLGNCFSIELQDTDCQVLFDFKDLLEYDGDVRFYNRSVKPNITHDTYVLRINSTYMASQLTKLGCVQNKSLILDFPNWITEDIFPFFLKGYIDGDGWVQKYRIGFMSTDKFCNGVKNYLYNHYNINSRIYDMKKHYNEHTKTMDITHRKNIIPLVELMFSKPTIGIPRKINKYIEYGFLNNNSLSA